MACVCVWARNHIKVVTHFNLGRKIAFKIKFLKNNKPRGSSCGRFSTFHVNDWLTLSLATLTIICVLWKFQDRWIDGGSVRSKISRIRVCFRWKQYKEGALTDYQHLLRIWPCFVGSVRGGNLTHEVPGNVAGYVFENYLCAAGPVELEEKHIHPNQQKEAI